MLVVRGWERAASFHGMDNAPYYLSIRCEVKLSRCLPRPQGSNGVCTSLWNLVLFAVWLYLAEQSRKLKSSAKRPCGLGQEALLMRAIRRCHGRLGLIG